MKKAFFKGYHIFLPWFIILMTFIYLFVVFGLSYFVDIKFTNILGLNDWLISKYTGDFPFLWIHMFTEGSPTEHLQWLFLGTAAVLSIILFINKLRQSSIIYSCWFFLSIGLIIMFFEDTINLRHKFAGYIAAYYWDVTSVAEWIIDPRRMYIELILYTFLALIMLLSFYYIFKDKSISSLGKKFLIFGYLLYGLAAFASATRHLFCDWYTIVGRFVLMRIYPSNWVPVIQDWDALAFRFMDDLVEESIELLAAAFLLAALTVFITSIKKSSEPAAEEAEENEPSE